MNEGIGFDVLLLVRSHFPSYTPTIQFIGIDFRSGQKRGYLCVRTKAPVLVGMKKANYCNQILGAFYFIKNSRY